MHIKLGGKLVEIASLSDCSLLGVLSALERRLPDAKAACDAEERPSRVVAGVCSPGPQGEAAMDY